MAINGKEKEEELYPRLCGSTLFYIVLRFKKKKTGVQEKCLKDFLSIIDPSVVKGVYENTLHRYASDLRNAKPMPEDGNYVRFGNPDVCSAFRDELKNDEDAVLKRIKDFCDKYFLDTTHLSLVRALLELIDGDKVIDEHNRSLNVEPGFIPALKEEILKPDAEIHFYNFLLGVWYYIYQYFEGHETGKETIEHWTEKTKAYSEDKPNYKFDSSEKFVNIHLVYETDRVIDNRVKIEEGEKSTKIVMPNGIVPDLATFDPEDDEGVLVLETQEIISETDKYSRYVKMALETYRMSKGFLDAEERPFRDFYVCGNVKRKLISPIIFKDKHGSEIPSGNRVEKEIPDIRIDDLTHHFCIFSGNGGAGKSMLLKKFFLDVAEVYQPGMRVPIMISVSAYKPDSKSLEFLLARELKTYDSTLGLSDLYQLLDTGRAVCLLDGYDEIDKEYIHDFQDELDCIKNGRPDSYFIISSRNISEIHTLKNYCEYELCNLDMDQAEELIIKLDPKRVDAKLKQDFIDRLRRDAFHFNRDERREYVGNPLFLTLMIRTFELINDIPTERYVFYEKTYVAMASEYDSKTKRLSRKFYTGLKETSYKKYFAEFCGLSYSDCNYRGFDRELLMAYFTQIVEDNGLDIEPEMFIKDAIEIICLMYKDGQTYEFVHRSFQEYFAAVYYLELLRTDPDTVREILANLDAKMGKDETLSMMYGMGESAMEKYIILPYLEKMFKSGNDEEDYKAYLCDYYAGIEYVTGDLDEDMCTNDDQKSALYAFIRSQYEIDYGYLSGAFERDESFADDSVEYFWIEETWFDSEANIGNMRLVTRNEIPYSLLTAKGYDTPYDAEEDYDHGNLCEIDIEKAINNKENNEAVYDIIMSDSFPLKEQFFKFKKVYVKLKDKYENAPKKKFGLRKG